MKKIYKYEIKPDELRVEMPQGAKIVHVDNQREHLCLWAEIDPDAPVEVRQFAVFPTGGHIPEYPDVTVKHLGTVNVKDGFFIFHVYEVIKIPQ